MVLAGWALWYQFTGPNQVHQTLQAFGGFVTDPLGFLIPTANQLIAPPSLVAISEHFRGNLAEWDAYLGLPLAGSLPGRYGGTGTHASCRWSPRPPSSSRSSPSDPTSSSAVISSPSRCRGSLTEHIPVVKNLLPNRFMADVFLLAGVAIAYVIAQLKPLPLTAHWRAGVIALAAILLAVSRTAQAEHAAPAGRHRAPNKRATCSMPAASCCRRRLRPPTIRRRCSCRRRATSRSRCPAATPTLPIFHRSPAPSALAQLDAPGSVQLRAAALASAKGRTEALSLLRASHVQTIVVLAGSGGSEFRAFWTALLGRPPAVYGGVAIWTGVTGPTAGS